MTRRDFEIRAAEFFLCDSEEFSIEEQIDILYNVDEDELNPAGVLIWDPFENYPAGDLIELIENLADNYEEFYNMTNERFKD
jgi:hypothetical protein